jgi:hypothetical protein
LVLFVLIVIRPRQKLKPNQERRAVFSQRKNQGTNTLNIILSGLKIIEKIKIVYIYCTSILPD